MRRYLFVLLLLVSFLFQGAGVSMQRGLGTGHDDHTHASLHLQDVAHHHPEDSGDDHGVVVDNSAESASHLASDGALNSPALPAVPTVLAALTAPGLLPRWQQPAPPSPDLQGLRRPPRHVL